ncbi:hypothetical protein SDC9_200924 [bioreactor metagenome]|uniref:Uncharacterized protein n=1 Tax=bioreactor metagenome TaxID=1076179 RepID=A0A645IQM6_9ZZZZ
MEKRAVETVFKRVVVQIKTDPEAHPSGFQPRIDVCSASYLLNNKLLPAQDIERRPYHLLTHIETLCSFAYGLDELSGFEFTAKDLLPDHVRKLF